MIIHNGFDSRDGKNKYNYLTKVNSRVEAIDISRIISKCFMSDDYLLIRNVFIKISRFGEEIFLVSYKIFGNRI